jgi:hypothetical protein
MLEHEGKEYRNAYPARVSRRTYTVEEANMALPEVRSVVERIVELAELIPDLQDQAHVAEYRAARQDSLLEDRALLDQWTVALQGAEDELIAAVRRLGEMGVALKDPRVGLVDFYGYRDGELVELCWKLGEDSVAHWHRIGEGFPGRQPL